MYESPEQLNQVISKNNPMYMGGGLNLNKNTEQLPGGGPDFSSATYETARKTGIAVPQMGNVSVSPSVVADSTMLNGQPKTLTDINTALQTNNNTLGGKLDGFLNRIDQYQSQIAGLMNPTAEEDALAGQINDLDTNTERALTQLDNQPIISSIAQGQQSQVQKLASITKSGLARQLGTLQGTRQQKLQAAQFLYDSARNSIQDTLALYKATAPENIGTQVNDATGDVYVITKNPMTGEVSTQIAGNVGAKTGLTNVSIQTDPSTNQLVAIGQDASGNFVSKPLGVQAEQKLNQVDLGDSVGFVDQNGKLVRSLKKTQLAQTEIVEVDGRKLLINSQTGGTIQDLGPITDEPGDAPTQAELSAAGFAERTSEADQILRKIESKFTSRLSILGKYSPNILKSSDRQSLEQAQRNFINAVLRRESGAVISPEEFKNAELQYFSQPGDTQSTLEQKRKNRETIIQNLKAQAGKAVSSDPLKLFDSSGVKSDPLNLFKSLKASSTSGASPVSADKVAEAIAIGESSGNYKAVSPLNRDGQRAYGKYQILASNIASWSREILGKTISVAQFLSDPKLQDKIAKAKISQYLEKFGTPEDVAVAWFAGPGAVGKNSRATDVTGTSVPKYVQIFRNNLKKIS